VPAPAAEAEDAPVVVTSAPPVAAFEVPVTPPVDKPVPADTDDTAAPPSLAPPAPG
jgi:hypothetical protein